MTIVSELMQREWESTNRLLKLNDSAVSALRTYDLHNKSLMFEASSVVQHAMASMSSLRLAGESAVQKIGRGIADFDFGFRRAELDAVAQSVNSLSIVKDSLAMHKLSHMGIWADAEKHQEVAKSVQRMLEPIRGLDSIRDSIVAQASAKLGIVAEMQRSMERYSSVNIAQRASMSMLGVSAIQEALGFSSSAVQQAMNTVKHMRLFEESESVAKAIKQMDSMGALVKSIQALNQEDSFARAVRSFNAMNYHPSYELAIPDLELAENIALIESATESDFADIFTKLSPRFQGILIYIFYRILFPIALGVAGNLMTPYFEKAIKSEKLPTSQVRIIKKTPFQDVDTSNLRFVFSNDVKLRAKPSTHSEVLDVLVIGQVITVLERKKGWAEVIYVNDDDQACQGWIMTRYTAKFKK